MHDGRTLASCCTADIVPVDLNAFMYQMESNMAAFAARLGHEEAAATFSTAVRARRAAIDELMHDRPAGAWCRLLRSHHMSARSVGSLCNALLFRCVGGAVVGTIAGVGTSKANGCSTRGCCMDLTVCGDAVHSRAVVRPAHHIQIR